jgi:hypothetical protein
LRRISLRHKPGPVGSLAYPFLEQQRPLSALLAECTLQNGAGSRYTLR